ncbi:MAG: ribonuclease HII [Robiginitomaculum sp.]|nr:ribonuclease HII [Robiginitomaculum sp.]MDQ7077167.1 ribonuclease HII [Robiginitomaculum sp.]
MPDYSLERAATGRVCGVDEVGRGPGAGPVVAAAVILDPAKIPAGLNDSKKLSQKRREYLFEVLIRNAHFGLGMAEPEEIDRLNILHASMTAMERAVAALPRVPDHALIDGNRLPKHLPCTAAAIIKGDGKSVSIAAASIIAKVVRDRLMVRADELYPGYGFAAHKGYLTKVHKVALQSFGPCPIHRFSFAPVAASMRLNP